MRAHMSLKRVVAALAALMVLVALLIVAYQRFSDPSSNYPGTAPTDLSAQVRRGAYLAQAGNCMACHTARGGERYAGGRAIDTPFGNIYASNLTPDPTTGIGTWSADDFWRALHDGKSKDGSFLYPAFPYPNYTKVTRADSDALFTYLNSVPAVTQQNREHELRFPYNQRFLLAFWRTLYFSPGVFEADKAQSAAWNRGAYLVQGLGHCAACHASRDAAGGMAANDLGGGMIPMLNWYAPSLGSHAESGLGGWSDQEIADLLSTGVSARGAVFGPMAEVVGKSLQHMAPEDIGSMVTYLRTLPNDSPALPRTAQLSPAVVEATLKRGERLYASNCIECHGADGKGAPPAYPPLAGNTSLSAALAVNPIRMVLNGGYPPSTNGNPRPYGMPPFSASMSDEEIAAVVSYVRTAWGNQGAVVSGFDVSRLRGAPMD